MQKMGGDKYFWDTYAVIELINGNLNYAKYAQEEVILTIFNLAEVYWVCLNEYSEDIANELYEKYSRTIVQISDEVLKEAIKFRKQNKKKDLSYTDCIGYIYSLRNNLKFLTGDKEFQGLKNVEFVK